MQHSKLSVFPSGILPQRMLMEKPCQHGPFFQKTNRKKNAKTNKGGNVQLSHHRQQIRKRALMPLYITATHDGFNTGLLAWQILIALTPLYM